MHEDTERGAFYMVAGALLLYGFIKGIRALDRHLRNSDNKSRNSPESGQKQGG